MGLFKPPERIFDRATQSFLGSPTSALYLSLLRILVPLWCLIAGEASNAPFLSQLPSEIFLPVSFYEWAGFTSATVTPYLYYGFQIALVLLLLGIFARISALYCLLVGSYLLGFSYNLGYTAHSANLLPFLFLIFTLSPSSDYLSVSRLIVGRKIHGLLSYSLPVHFIRVLLIFIYFSAGVMKLRTSGLDFVTSDHLAIKLAQSEIPFSLWLAQFPLVCHILAASALAIQLLSPLALIWRTRYFVLFLLAFQVGTSLIGAHFPLYSLLFILWFPFRKIMRFTPIFNETTPKPLFFMKSFYLYSALFITFVTCLATKSEFWPFSYFPMYADTSYIQNGLVRYELKVVKTDGAEIFYPDLSPDQQLFPKRRIHAYFRKMEKTGGTSRALEQLYWSLAPKIPELAELVLCRREWLPVTPQTVVTDIPCERVAGYSVSGKSAP